MNPVRTWNLEGLSTMLVLMRFFCQGVAVLTWTLQRTQNGRENTLVHKLARPQVLTRSIHFGPVASDVVFFQYIKLETSVNLYCRLVIVLFRDYKSLVYSLCGWHNWPWQLVWSPELAQAHGRCCAQAALLCTFSDFLRRPDFFQNCHLVWFRRIHILKI